MKLIFETGVPGRRGSSLPAVAADSRCGIAADLMRSQAAELPEVSELDAVRHFTALARMNYSVDGGFYPLGSCTMKYNPKFHEKLAALSGFAELHPLLPQLRHGGALTQGALEVIFETQRLLSELTGFSEFTMQPMAGAHGELTGVMIIAAYHRHRGDSARRVMLIPDAAHGTNPASASMAGFEIKEVATDADGNVDLDDLASKLGPDVAGFMLTCPNTLGLFDPHVEKIVEMVHAAGALAYCDGANFNAIMGRVRPGDVGFDVMHLNLHKSFSTPHGGGGPGSGPVGVREDLRMFLPVSRVMKRSDGTYALSYQGDESIGYVAPFYGNFGVIVKAYAYLLTLGRDGVTRVGENAVINANYVLAKLRDAYPPKYPRHCMHECVLSAAGMAAAHGVHALDVSKALIDRGIHPPTMYFPMIVPEALMVEPTETESKDTLDEFIAAMLDIAKQAETSPESLHAAPVTAPVGRLDETAAARKPELKF
ncbi:MAG: aminomethyl-transferring glycine dehydrogenase subunit GcvPB [Victivallaceae bacterium]|nr:aminomethyl-transferring glycine dehydrogenase subunit GcvPB [Victivallaceae bacterium]